MNRVKTLKPFGIVIIIAACTVALLLILAATFATPVFADEGTAEENIPKEGVTYTLTYPDGTVVTENEDGTPLTYEDVVRMQKEENWKKLGGGYTSDENGEVQLPDEWTDGTIKIVETKVPDGYEQGDESEKIVELADGETTFVNPKKTTTKKRSKTTTPKTAAARTTSKSATAVKTGDETMLTGWVLAIAAAAAVLGTMIYRRKG